MCKTNIKYSFQNNMVQIYIFLFFYFYYLATQNNLQVHVEQKHNNWLINIKFKMRIQLGRRDCGREISEKQSL